MGLESFRKAASSPEWLKFIGEAFRLGAAGDEAEGLVALPMAFVQVSDVTESRLLHTMKMTAATFTSRLCSVLPVRFENLIYEHNVKKEDD